MVVMVFDVARLVVVACVIILRQRSLGQQYRAQQQNGQYWPK